MMTRFASPRLTALSHSAAPYLALLAGMVALACGTSFAKSLFPVLGAEGTSAMRVGLAALILLAIWRPWRFGFSRRDLTAMVLYGVVTGGMNLMFYMSLRTIPLGLALAIEFTGPLTLALVHARRPIHFVWVGCAVAGLVMLLPIGRGAIQLDPVGVLLAGMAGVCWALYIVFGKRMSHLPAGPSVAIGMTTAALVILPFGVARAGLELFNPALLLAGLAVAVFSSALPYSLEMIALRRLPERTFGVLTSGEPAVGALAGLLFLSEQLSGLQWLAIAAIVVAASGSIATAGFGDRAAVTPAPAE
ncbi:EamA family transporter [Asticcacaulis sp. AC460]|uniref:EamA family transporter n=1 Tax=Asticcacaulis sp. AC460 TaxID=1282360 RepID=UPI0009DE558B|nr:DMT family transporter [Asticcacaulis sp. AC460]